MRAALAELRAVGAPISAAPFIELENCGHPSLLDAHGLPRPRTTFAFFAWRSTRAGPTSGSWSSWTAGRSTPRARAFQEDRERGNALELAGWRLLRFTWADVTRQPRRRGRRACAGRCEFGSRYPPDTVTPLPGLSRRRRRGGLGGLCAAQRRHAPRAGPRRRSSGPRRDGFGDYSGNAAMLLAPSDRRAAARDRGAAWTPSSSSELGDGPRSL